MADGKKHFCLIFSMSRLLRKGNERNQRFYCDNCLNSRRTEESLEKHKLYCESFKACKTVFPKEDFMQFKNFKNQTSIPLRIYADSEAILKPAADQGHGEFREHQPSGFCFYAVAESFKSYSIKMDDSTEKKRCKGVKENVKKSIMHEDLKKKHFLQEIFLLNNKI